MSEDQFNSVSQRVYQLEQNALKRNIQNRARLIIQFFLLLVTTLTVGYYFYQHLEAEIENLDRNQALRFDNLDKKNSAMIAAQIVNQIEKNEDVRTAIKKFIEDNFQGRIEETSLTEEETKKTEATPPQISKQASDSDKPSVESANVSETVLEQVTDDSVKKEQTTPKSAKNFKAASKFEAQGFNHLLAGEFDKAIDAFDKSENSFPTFHQVYEISRLLRKERAKLDDPVQRKQIYQQIVNNLNYKAPPEMLDKLKKLASKDGIAIKTDD
ncbi:MAG: hypothetical protein GY757_22385 [bacterium]|nr:hypothetical protein [bacterium]